MARRVISRAATHDHTFLIITHGGHPGVFLSVKGGWGNLPYPSDEAAARAARLSAGADTFNIERKTIPARGRRLRDTDPAWLL